MNFEFLIIIVFFNTSFFISLLLFFLIITIVYSNNEVEKSSSYECGFHSFQDNRQEFNVRFYLVSILFIIFDLEVIFLFVWLTTFRFLELSFFIISYFLIILVIGFIYEWLKGALVWE